MMKRPTRSALQRASSVDYSWDSLNLRIDDHFNVIEVYQAETVTSVQESSTSQVTSGVVTVFGNGDLWNRAGFQAIVPDWFIFNGLVKKWHHERGATSSMTRMVACPSYQRIIGMGERAMPLIFDRLEAESTDPDHWNWALTAITGESPVAENDMGNTRKIAQAWLAWAQDNDAR